MPDAPAMAIRTCRIEHEVNRTMVRWNAYGIMCPTTPYRSVGGRQLRNLGFLLCLFLLPKSSAGQTTADSAKALYEAGMTFSLGVPPNYAEAAKSIRLAADQGYAKAQTSLGELYQNGFGVPKDIKEAIKWFNKAANQGELRAQTWLANAYANGVSVKQDDKEALKWLQKAAGQGEPSAQTVLGAFYASGRGLDRNPGLAMEWYRKAASQNFPMAQFALGSAYEMGLAGFEMSLDEAASWYRRAAAQGLDAAKASLAKIEPDIALSTTPVRVDGDLAKLNLISNPRPRYPPAARARRAEGYVMMEAIIASTGRVRSLKIVHGDPLFDEPSLAAASQWRYKPQIVNGEPVQVLTVITINFSIQYN